MKPSKTVPFFVGIILISCCFFLLVTEFPAAQSDTGNSMLGSRGTACFDAPLEFDKDIPVALAVGTNEQPDIVKIDAIRFEMRGDQIVHKLYGFLLRPWPHTDWRFRFELFNEHGSVVGSIKYNMHNRGRSETETANEPEPVKSDFCPIGPKGLTGANKPTRFAINIEQKPLETENITRTHNIHGTLVDATENMPEEFWKELEAAQSAEEADKVFKKDWLFQRLPLCHIAVTLRGKSVTKQTVTDAQGKFEFTDLSGPTYGPYGGMADCENYEISAEIPIQSGQNGENRPVTVKQQVKLDSEKDITLKFRTDLITMKGRVSDTNGRPISNAKITAIWGINDHELVNYWDNHDHPKWFAMSKDDGSYELEGIEPANFYRVGGYLYSGNPYTHVDILVEANGFVQDKNNIPKVPIVSDNGLIQARRFFKLVNQKSQKAGRPEMHEKEGLNLPSINGNTITDINIVLEHKVENDESVGKAEGNDGWGEGVEGLQSRLRPLESSWNLEQTPTLVLDLKNQGETEVNFVRIAQAHCEIEVEGQWYGWAKPIEIAAPVWRLKPGEELYDAFEIKLVDSWALPKEGNKLRARPGIEEFWGNRLKLTPGKHTVRVRFRPQEWVNSYIKGEKDLFIVSNSVEIKILPEEKASPAVSKNES